MEIDHYYVSARAYAQETGLDPATVKAELKAGKLEGFETKGQYKVKVYKNGSIPLKEYMALLERYKELETKLKSIESILGKG